MARIRSRGTPDTIERWLKRQCEECGAAAVASSRVELWYGGDRVLSRWKGSALVAGDRAEAILSAAQDHCDELGSTSSYVLRFVVGEETQGSTDVRCLPAIADIVEAPNAEGQILQQMRHSETSHKTLVQGVSVILEGAAELIKAANAGKGDAESRVRDLERELERVRREQRDAEAEDEPSEPSAAKTIMDALAPHVAKEIGPEVGRFVKGMLSGGEPPAGSGEAAS